MGTISQVLVDDAAIYIEDPAANGSSYVLAGYTEEGSEFTYTPTNAMIDVHEETVPIDAKIEAEEMTITAILAESTLTNLTTAIAGASTTSDTMTLGGGVMRFIRAKLVTIDPDDVTKFRKIELYKCAINGPVTLASRRTEKTQVQLTLTGIKSASPTAGVGQIVKNLATATS
jgi:hypothetical protein